MSNTDSLVFHNTAINYDFVISKLEEGQKRVHPSVSSEMCGV